MPMTANLRKPTSTNPNGPLIIMIAASLLAHALLLGSSAMSWTPGITLPDSNRINIQLVQAPTRQALPTLRQSEDSNQGRGNTSAPDQLASHRQPTAKPEQAEQSAATPPASNNTNLLHENHRKKPALADVTPAQHTASAPVSAAKLLGQIATLGSVQRGDSDVKDSTLESGSADGAGDSANRYAWARYKEDWRLRMERIGQQNYPEALRQQHIYGSVTLAVSILPDGSLQDIKVVRKSGNSVVDDAAINLVTRHAPFGRFPPSLAGKGTLTIVKAFTFSRDNN